MKSRATKILETMRNGGKWTVLRVSESMGCTQREAYASMAKLRNAIQIRPGRKDGVFMEYTITEKGLDRLKRVAAIEAAREMRYIPTEPMVNRAMRTVPNSVFSLGAM